MKEEVVCGSHTSPCRRSDPQREEQPLHLIVMPGMAELVKGTSSDATHEPGGGEERRGGGKFP